MLIIQPRWIVHKDKEGKSDQTIFSCHTHPDGSHLATGGLDSTVKIWNVDPIIDSAQEDDPSCHKLLSTLTGHGGAVLCVRWSATGRRLASSSDDTVVLVWERDLAGVGGKVFGSSDVNHESYKVIRRLAGHTSDVSAVAWNVDETYLATGGLDSVVLVYDARSFQCIRRLAGHSGFVKGVFWDPVGEYLASQSDDKTVKIWRTGDWTLETSIAGPFKEAPTASFCMRLSWSPDGTHIVTPNSTNNGVFVAAVTDRYRWQSNVSLVGHPNVVEVTAFNPLIFKNTAEADGDQLCTLLALAARSSISLWITSRARPLVVIHDLFERDILDLSWSDDGLRLFCCSSEGHVACLQFQLDEFPPVVSSEDRDAYMQSFGFKKPVLPVYHAPLATMQTQQIRAPTPQKMTIVNGKRRIQPSFVANLEGATTYATPEPTLPRPPAQPSVAQREALERRMTARPAFGLRDEGITTSGFDAPLTSIDSQSPRKRKLSTSLLVGPEEDLGLARLPPAPPRGARSRAPGQSITWTSVDVEDLEPPKEWDRLHIDDVKLERPAIKSFASVPVAGAEDPAEAERLEWRNYADNREPTEVVQREPDKVTPLWLDYLASCVVMGVINSSFAAVGCADGSIIVYSPTGRRLLPQMQLDAPCAYLDVAGSFLLAVTSSGRLHIWNVLKGHAALDPLHLRSLLVDSTKLTSVTIRPNGTPVVTLSDGQAFAFDASLRAWIRLSASPWYARSSELWETRVRGRTLSSARGVVRHLEGAVNDLIVSRIVNVDAMDEDEHVQGEMVPPAAEGKTDYPAALALDHLESRMSTAVSLGSPTEYKQFLAQYAQRIADEGFRAKGEELVKELLGPVYHKPGVAWTSEVLGMPKRELLRDVLTVFGRSIALKKVASDTTELLRKVAAEDF